MFCLPYGTESSSGSEDWLAYAYADSYLSVFNDERCVYPSYQMHELGHNLNHGHSGIEGNTYGDKSCLMGYSYSYDNWPQMCFNGAKSFIMGWYSDGHVTVNSQFTSFSGKLIGIDDYDQGNLGENKMIIKLEGIDTD